ncbi:MAG: Chromosome partition protein Smc [Fimbriimonadaceae bacterium]|nr:Chromosome partition protein Smc [Fimbriimonadaceae bacterium]
MDGVSFWFIALIVVLSGVVSFLADILGRKLGKKRLSLFGLRPRTVAALTVAVVGMLIPLVTILILASASRDVSEWLTRGSRALEDLRMRDSQLKKSTEELQRLTEDIKRLEEQQKTESLNIARIQREKTKTEGDLKGLTENYRRLEQDSREVRAKLQKEQAGLSTARKELQALTRSRKEVEDRFNQLERISNTLSQHNLELDRQLQEKDRQIASKEKEIGERTKRVEELTKNSGELERELADLQGRLKTIQQDLDNRQRELETANLAIDGARAEVSRLEMIGQQLAAGLGAARTRPMIYRFGDEVSRLPVPERLKPDDAASHLTTIMRGVRVVAEQRGAKASETEPVAGMRSVQLDNGKTLTVEEQEAQIIRSLSNKADPFVLIAYSVWNSFEGEPLWVRVETFPNPLVFKQGQIVAEMRIDGSQGEEAILENLRTLITERVRQAAIKAKMIGATGRDVQFGEVPNDRIIALMREIRTAARNVRVVALAAADTRAADRLELDFRLR